MATVSLASDQTAEMLQKLTLDSQRKPLEIPAPTKKTAVYHAGPVDANSQEPFDRSVTSILPVFMDPTLCYVQNGYQPYYFGGFATGNDWNEYQSYTNNDGSGIDMASGVYGENGLGYAGYGYAPYPYSPATSPVPTAGTDGSLYGAQPYQYLPYFPLNPGSESFTPSVTGSFLTEHSTEKVTGPNPLPETANVASNSISKSGDVKINSSTRAKPGNQGSSHTSINSYGSGVGGVFPMSYQDQRLAYEGFPSPMPPHDDSKFSDGRRQVSGTKFTSSLSRGNNVPASQNLIYASNSNFMGSHQQVGAQGYYNRAYPNKSYSQFEGGLRSGVSYGSTGYDSRTNGRGWLAYDWIRNRGRGNNYFRENSTDGFNELNRGPRAKSAMNQTDVSETTLVAKGQNGTSNVASSEVTVSDCVAPDRTQYNREDFCEEYADAKFFVIKSYSEDDVHKSIKYNVWASTPNGNKKLDAAYQESQQKSGGCPVFLFFSVNTSGQFVGVAEMVGPVDFSKNVGYWQQDKWTGSFPLKWHIVNDVPNSLLRHITLENNENKPVTNSRDTQEVKLEQGLKMIKILKDHSSKTCILDDFSFYEARQKTIQEKKAMLQQYQNQTLEGKSVDGQRESSNGDLKVSENRLVARKEDLAANEVANGC